MNDGTQIGTRREGARLHVLGGGPAGLGAGYYAVREGIDPVIYESGEEVGGNCRTLRLGPFLFDTGAHRFHDKDPEITADVRELLGDDLRPVDAPSAIRFGDRFVEFPLHLGALLESLPLKTIIRIAVEATAARLRSRNDANDTFEDRALRSYGRTLAEMFLLNYSKKLWGIPTDRLSPVASGGRLKGLNVGTFLRRTLLGRDTGRENIDGRFWYPTHGIGMIPDRLAEAIGGDRIETGSRVTRITRRGDRIISFELNGERTVPCDKDVVVSTLPLTLTLRLLDPQPPPEIMTRLSELRYRNVVLAVFGIAREQLSGNASIYFPESTVPFTRLYEPKNRSALMAPPGMTSVVAEIPCWSDDSIWQASEEDVRSAVEAHLRQIFDLRPEEITTFGLYRVPFAYPVMEKGLETLAETLRAYLARFGNLHLIGRGALFQYTHVHDLLRAAKETIEQSWVP